MATNKVKMTVMYRKNKNERSRGFNHYYAESKTKETLTTKGIVKHIKSHDTSLGTEVIVGVLNLLSKCIPELLSEGVPVKIDGLGIFRPTIANKKLGATEAQMLDSEFTPSSIIDGVRIRFIPEGCDDDNITSRHFLTRSVSVDSEFIVESMKRTVGGKEVNVQVLKTLEDFRNPAGE